MSIKRILQCLGVGNLLFVIFNGCYHFSSSYFENTTVILALLTLVILSFVKDIFDYVGVKIPNELLHRFFSLITIIISGIPASLALLIPKLILMESQHLDSLPVKFTVRITRLWDKSELSICLNELIENRGISNLISDTDRTSIVENSNSMSELRSSLNALVNERLELLKSDMSGGVIEVQTVVQESSWFSENIVLTMTISVIAIVAIAGIGYLLYTNSGSFNNSEPTTGTGSMDDSNLRDIETRVAEISALVKSNPTVDIDKLVKAATDKVETELANITATVTLFGKSGQRVMDNAQSIANLSKTVNNLSKSIKELTSTVGVIGNKTVNLETSIKSLRASANKANQISEDAFLDKAMKLVEEKVVGETAPSGIGVASKELSDRLDVISKKVNRESLMSREVSKKFSDRIETLEKSNSNALETNASFVKIMVDAAKEEILGSSEFVAMGILLGNETIREMLVNEEVKNLIGDIKKKG